MIAAKRSVQANGQCVPGVGGTGAVTTENAEVYGQDTFDRGWFHLRCKYILSLIILACGPLLAATTLSVGAASGQTNSSSTTVPVFEPRSGAVITVSYDQSIQTAVDQAQPRTPIPAGDIRLGSSQYSDSHTGIKNYVAGNTSYDNIQLVNNTVNRTGLEIKDGGGIIIDANSNSQTNGVQYAARTLVVGNVTKGNHSEGIQVRNSSNVNVTGSNDYGNNLNVQSGYGDIGTPYSFTGTVVSNNVSTPDASAPVTVVSSNGAFSSSPTLTPSPTALPAAMVVGANANASSTSAAAPVSGATSATPITPGQGPPTDVAGSLSPVLPAAQTTCPGGSSVAGPAGIASGGFTTQNGQIIGPNGQPFQPLGVDVGWGWGGSYTGGAPSAATLLAQFPGINMVRLAVFDYASPAELQSYIADLTSHNIVVEISDYTNSSGNDSGGGNQGGVVFSGQELTNELNWYSSIGSAFANNPDVWFGTDNEPSDINPATGQADPNALAQWQLATYNAIRSAGNHSPVLLEPIGYSPQTANVGLPQSVYSQMTNTIWDQHYYGWVSGYSTDQSKVSQDLATTVTNDQAITNANGVMPVIIGEYGPSTTGGGTADPNGQQVLVAVQSIGLGNTAWSYNTGTDGTDALLSSSGGLTSFGQEVQDYIKASATSCAGVPAISTPLLTSELTPAMVNAPGDTLIANAPSDTQPIDTKATNDDASVAGAPANNTTPLPIGPAPSTTNDGVDPIASSPVTSGLPAQVIPKFATDGSVSETVAAAVEPPATSNSPAGDPAFWVAQGTPQQVVPKYGSGYTSSGVTDRGTTQMDGTVDKTPVTYITPSTGPSDTPQLKTLLAQSYGQTAVDTADQLGVNPAAVAAIAQVESNFQNVGTANGSTTATGPWQFTQGTFQEISQSNNLGFSSSDLTNPNDQATEAPYYLQQIASTISAATGEPATTLQAYGGWVFGPDAGAQIANASNSTPLSALVSAQSLANNGMSNWTVGDFRTAMTTKLGSAANQTVLTTQGI